jgi:hypothetical protein
MQDDNLKQAIKQCENDMVELIRQATELVCRQEKTQDRVNTGKLEDELQKALDAHDEATRQG